MDDLEQIRRLKYRYLRTLDTKDWDGFADCFVPSATGRYAGLDLDGRDAIVDYMRTNLTDAVITLHQCHHPEIDLHPGQEGAPDTATGVWYLQDKVIVEAFDYVLEGAAFYDDSYVRTDDGWRISATGYRRTYEMTHRLSELPGVTVRINPTH